MGGTIDLAATSALRAELRQARPPVAKTDGLAFDFGTNRVAWESVFDDALMNRIVAAILALSPGARRTARRRLFQPIADLLQPAGPIDAAALRRSYRWYSECLQNLNRTASVCIAGSITPAAPMTGGPIMQAYLSRRIFTAMTGSCAGAAARGGGYAETWRHAEIPGGT